MKRPSRWLYFLMWWHGWRAAVHDANQEVALERFSRAAYQYHRTLRDYHEHQREGICRHLERHLT